MTLSVLEMEIQINVGNRAFAEATRCVMNGNIIASMLTSTSLNKPAYQCLIERPTHITRMTRRFGAEGEATWKDRC